MPQFMELKDQRSVFSMMIAENIVKQVNTSTVTLSCAEWTDSCQQQAIAFLEDDRRVSVSRRNEDWGPTVIIEKRPDIKN